MEKKTDVWECKIGFAGHLPQGADHPLRQAVQEAFERVAGHPAHFCFSGWGQTLTETEKSAIDKPTMVV